LEEWEEERQVWRNGRKRGRFGGMGGREAGLEEWEEERQVWRNGRKTMEDYVRLWEKGETHTIFAQPV
jgi:hypothetical protein